MVSRPVDISLLMSSRNRAQGLATCLEAVATAALQAKNLQLEFVFVDNGSTDNTSEIVRNWSQTAPIATTLIYEKRPGLAVARNTGIRAASGKILAFTDDDCEVFPDYFLQIQKAFEGDHEPVLRGGRIELGDSRDLPVTIKPELEPAVLTADLHAGGFIHGANMAFSRALIDKIGLFDTRFGAGTAFRSGEDTDFTHRAFNAGIRVEYLPDFAVKHFHGRRLTEEVQKLQRGYAFGNGALYAKYLFDRRSNMRGMLRWDIRQAVRELITRKRPNADLGFTHSSTLKDSVAGMIAYWRSGKLQEDQATGS
ncbi:glycosyltransferase family 2 protein [Oryzifoliimicrobium ureilyticus]|uniref:glycosyltransferase family 2 protein n=1 Tax=Oryzifoliimicrobium ureilyticus TaxID=3113724 RepID=UPI0030764FC8